jgi:Ser/Thr protein kinase RdoA (MazF antagonist)
MHRHARSWTLPHGFQRKRWDMDAMVGPNGYWGPWRAGIGLEQPGIAVLEQALLFIQRRIERFGVGPARFGLVHADLRLANLLVDGAHLRVIDFDDCGFSWFVYDFATAVSFIEHEPIVPDLLQAWLRGYRNVAPLEAQETAEIPSFVVLRRILLTAWLASHSEIPFAAPVWRSLYHWHRHARAAAASWAVIRPGRNKLGSTAVCSARFRAAASSSPVPAKALAAALRCASAWRVAACWWCRAS